MKAVAYQRSLPVENPESLQDVELPEPVPGPRDLLVEVRAVSVNPVDTKVRRRAEPPAGEWKILGWDAAGVVRAIGAEVTLFAPGDRVWYAGELTRQGTDAELHAVDERVVGPMPQALGFAEAAALPLTAITAWELLFDRLGVARSDVRSGDTLLVIGAAGGVGSILVQLAARLTGLTVIGTASRPETKDWVRELGAHHVLDHSLPLKPQLEAAGVPAATHVASLTHTDVHFAQLVDCLAPQGRLALIDDPGPLDVAALKRKSLSLHWEFMFTRSMFRTPDMAAQHQLLREVAGLVDRGVLRTTVGQHFGPVTAANLRSAHAVLESNKARGKIVLEWR